MHSGVNTKNYLEITVYESMIYFCKGNILGRLFIRDYMVDIPAGMQEEVLKLILLALEDGSALSRKVLVLFVVQRLESQYPHASKTAIGHVVQLLYRASCFKV